jgi:hypothetical protein
VIAEDTASNSTPAAILPLIRGTLLSLPCRALRLSANRGDPIGFGDILALTPFRVRHSSPEYNT